MSERLHFPESRAEAQELVNRLLDAQEDAFDPRADLDRLVPNRCPGCKSTNVSDADDEGLIDCMDCGIWFNPLHPDNSPVRPQESLDDEIPDLMGYANKAARKPFGYMLKSTYCHTDSKGKKWPSPSPWLNTRRSEFVRYIGDGTVYKRINTAKQWPNLEAVPIYGDPRKYGEKVLDPNFVEPPQRRRFESLDDEIPDLNAYVMKHGLTPRILITFTKTTPESAEQGDYSESGWIDEEGVDMMPDDIDNEEGLTPVHKAVEFLWDNGATEFSSSDFDDHGWYSTGSYTVSYQTGEEEERSFHLRGFTPVQMQEVYDMLRMKRRGHL